MSLEILEPRIAPALTIAHPFPDVKAGVGKTAVTIDLDNLLAANGSFHTFVTLSTNFDSDVTTPGIQGDITIELFDDTAPLTVQNFLSYAKSLNKKQDYTGTFFERLVQGFVLQGGIFNTDGSTASTGVTVHNEFGASNVAGTVAMTKQGGDPNSASTAFFFNLGDNSSNLDNQNGGFTVFGKVTAGMDVLTKIAAIVPKNLTPNDSSSPFTSVPTQGGYVVDPAGKMLPPPSQLITITGVTVTPPLQASSPTPVTYTVLVTDLQGNPTTLITPTLAGDQLSLAFQKNGAGVAKVTVTAHELANGASTVMDDFTVTVLPNLAVTVSETLLSAVAPGDDGMATIKILNNGAAPASARVDIQLFLNPLAGGAPQLIGSLLNVPLSLASGASKTFKTGIEVPEKLVVDQSQLYNITASVTPVAGSTLPELFVDDNTNDANANHQIFNAFGTFNAGAGQRTNVPLTYVDAAGHRVTINLKHGGYGQFNLPSASGVPDLALYNTSGSSALSATVDLGHTTMGVIAVQQPPENDAARVALGTISLGAVDLTGDFFATGGVKKVTLGNLTATDGSTHQFQLGFYAESSSQKATVSLGNVTDYNFYSNQPVVSLKALSWRDLDIENGGVANGPEIREEVRSLYMESFSVAGVFEANFTTLTSALMKDFTVGGALHNSAVHLGGGVNKVVLGSMGNSDFLVGLTAVPASLGDYSSYALMRSFTIKGSLQTGSHIAAGGIGTVRVGSVDGAGSTGYFGFLADQISSYQRGSVKLAQLQAANAYDVQDFYKVIIF